jgi:hypothetical protein
MREATKAKLFLLAATGLLLSVLTVFFGTPFLRALRQTYGPTVYWSLGIILSAVAFPVWFFVGSIWIVVGAYHEIEKLGKGWWIAGLLSVLLSGGFGWLSATYSLRTNGIESREQVEALIGEMTASLEAVIPNVKIKAEDVFNQMPSFVVMTLMLALANAVLFDRKVYNWLALPLPEASGREANKLLELRVPDFFIWIALMALLFSTFSFNSKALGIVALNVVNVSAVLYFFQGLAVLETYLRAIKAGFLMRFVTYFILVGQFFILVSILGLIDFWAGFRGRIQKLNSQIGDR